MRCGMGKNGQNAKEQNQLQSEGLNTGMESQQQKTTRSSRKTDGRFMKGQKPHNLLSLKKLCMIGNHFGNWLVIGSPIRDRGCIKHLCRCNCGIETLVNHYSLVKNKSRGCKKCATIVYNTPLEKSLRKRGFAARSRCENTNDPAYPHYGARGIRFEFKDVTDYVLYCKELDGADIKKEVDRIDNNQGYCKGNLRWADKTQNMDNRRNTKRIIYENSSMSLQTFINRYTDLSRRTAIRLLEKGYCPEDLRRIAIIRRTGRPVLRRSRMQKGEPLRGCYDKPILLYRT